MWRSKKGGETPMDNSEFNRSRNLRGTERAVERQRLTKEIKQIGDAPKTARGDSLIQPGEGKSVVDPARQRQLDRTSLVLNPLGERRRRELSGRPLGAEERKIAREAEARFKLKDNSVGKARNQRRG